MHADVTVSSYLGTWVTVPSSLVGGFQYVMQRLYRLATSSDIAETLPRHVKIFNIVCAGKGLELYIYI